VTNFTDERLLPDREFARIGPIGQFRSPHFCTNTPDSPDRSTHGDHCICKSICGPDISTSCAAGSTRRMCSLDARGTTRSALARSTSVGIRTRASALIQDETQEHGRCGNTHGQPAVKRGTRFRPSLWIARRKYCATITTPGPSALRLPSPFDRSRVFIAHSLGEPTSGCASTVRPGPRVSTRLEPIVCYRDKSASRTPRSALPKPTRRHRERT
jgi:hypothetical protein